jgi:hypothetical protein
MTMKKVNIPAAGKFWGSKVKIFQSSSNAVILGCSFSVSATQNK